MAVLKKIIYILLSVIVLALIVAFFMPREVNSSVSKEINAPPNYLYNLVNSMPSQKFWNPWIGEDTTMVLSFGNKSEGVGASYSWKSKKMGDGTITYTKVVPNESIEAEMTIANQNDKAFYQHKFIADGNKTKMTWDFQSKMGYPSNIMGPIMKYMMKKYFKNGMDNIEKIVKDRFENKIYHGFKIEDATLNEFKFITSRNEVSFDQIDAFYAQNLAAIYQSIQNEGLTSTGSPCGLFYKWDEVNMKADMAVAVPVSDMKAIKDLSTEKIESKPGYLINYYGDRSKTADAHFAMDDYLKDHNLLSDIPIIEEYVTDPLVEKDPNKWLTKIIYYATARN